MNFFKTSSKKKKDVFSFYMYKLNFQNKKIE